jgi:Beta-propeller repeat
VFLSYSDAVMTFENGAAVRMRPVGANACSKPESLDPQASKSNYFIGNVPEHWHTNVPNYTRVRYRDIYPGVDLIYYGNQRQLEYDFVVAPSADAHKIVLDFQGTSKASLDREGNLVMHTTAGDLRWHKPVAYQEADGVRKLVACAYMRKGGQLGFKLAAYDRTKPLIIDPVLEYSTYLGGSFIDQAFGIAVDRDRNVYITGFAGSTDFPTTSNAFQTARPGLGNAFVTKFDAIGNVVYSTYLGGSNSPSGQGDQGFAIAVDAIGDAYVTGYTASTDFPTKNAFQKTLKSPETNAFVTKLDAAGNELVYSTYLGGSSFDGDQGNGIAVDADDNAYVTGFTLSADFPTKNAFQENLKGGRNAFITKLDAAGCALIYSTYLGGSGGDQGNGIAVDADHNAYVTGFTLSADFPTKNAFQNKLKAHCSDCTNAFVTKLDRDGDSLVYSTYLGGASMPDFAEVGNAIAVDEHGHAYVTGATNSTDFPTKNAFQRELKGQSGNAFITKFDADGDSLAYSTYLGGSGASIPSATCCGDRGMGIAVDAHGHAYVTGVSVSTDFPTKDAFQDKLKGSSDAFVTKIGAHGRALIYSSYLGGSGSPQFGDQGRGIAAD